MIITTHDISRQEDVREAVSSIRSGSADSQEVEETVRGIIDDVRTRGDAALIDMAWRLDGTRLEGSDLEVSAGERQAAWDSLDADARAALEVAEGRIARFARQGLDTDWTIEAGPGLTVGQVQRPLESVGIYVPGGSFPYPSTVLMTGVLAREAGVGDIVFCVPPSAGPSHGATLATTTMIGDCRVFRVGGAQAVAAMAYGTETVPRCRMVAGPGNVYVAAAKRLLSGVVSIDLEAGPSEVAVLADSTVDVSFAAADLMAQLEHDPRAVAVLVCESEEVLQTAREVLSGMTDGLSGEDELPGGVEMVWCSSRGLALEFLNELAPEHLELMVEGAGDLLPEIKSAGCVFVGPYSAVALGDYIAGPSHVLPTSGTASRLSGLKAGDFRRTMNVVSYTEEGFRGDSPGAVLLARLEGLGNHALSLDIRSRRS
jgi:histidinol dehydrogenase